MAPIVPFLAFAKLVLQLVFISGYGIFRDELYYLDCGRHLAWGYVDQPPAIAVVAWLTSLLGDSLLVIRLPAALAGAALVYLAGMLAREMEGGSFAQGLAALCVLVATSYLLVHHILTMNAFEPLFWMGCAYLVLRILATGDQKLWLWFAVLAGVGFLNKNSMLFFGFGVVVALLLERRWDVFRQRWIWIAGFAAFLIILPNLLWQARHGFPQLEILQKTRAQRDVHLSAGEFVRSQVLAMNPTTFPVWAGGLGFFFFTGRGRRFRVLGWIYLVILATFVALKAKFYYLLPAYPMLFAGGGALLESAFAPPRWRWLKPVTAAILLAAGIAFAPLMLPVLPVETYLRYARRIGIDEVKMENQPRGRLPQLYADMFGWENMEKQVARVYLSLSSEDRAKVAIAAQNYGEAGAIDYFGPKDGLPRAISGHNNYFLWGPGGATGEVMIVIGDNRERLSELFGDVRQAGIIDHPYARPDETDLPIWLCRKPKFDLQRDWKGIKKYG